VISDALTVDDALMNVGAEVASQSVPQDSHLLRDMGKTYFPTLTHA